MRAPLRVFPACVAGILTLSLGGCAGGDAPGVETSAVPSSNAVPSNYRELIARNVRAKVPPNTIIQAEISAPGMWVGPMGLGTPRPIACVKWRTQSSFGPADNNLGYTFAEGHIDEVMKFDPFTSGGLVGAAAKYAFTCGSLKYEPFPELANAR